MGIKKVLLLVLLFFSFSLFVPNHTKAATLSEILTSEYSLLTKISEGVEYFFAFKVENKVQVLEKHAEKRLAMAQEYADKGDEERTQSLIQNYQQIKERQNELLGKTDNGEVLGAVQTRTVEQQKTMEEIKLKVEGETKQNVIQTQERVVNQVAKRVVEVNGPEGTTEFLNDVAHVWAPGTGPGGGEAGVVYAGGGKLIYAPGTGPGGGEAGVVIVGGTMQFATGTSAGGSGGTDTKNVEVKTGGEGSGNTVIEGGNQEQNGSPNTTSGGEGAQNVIDE